MRISINISPEMLALLASAKPVTISPSDITVSLMGTLPKAPLTDEIVKKAADRLANRYDGETVVGCLKRMSDSLLENWRNHPLTGRELRVESPDLRAFEGNFSVKLLVAMKKTGLVECHPELHPHRWQLTELGYAVAQHLKAPKEP